MAKIHKLGWAGPSCARPSLSMLVVAIDRVQGNQLAEAIQRAPRWNQWGCTPVVHVATDISLVAEHAASFPLSIEMVVLMLEPERTHGLQWARNTIKYLQLEMRLSHLVLVDASDTPPLEKAVPQYQINNFCREHKLYLLRGSLKEHGDCECLADRVSLMFEQLMGLETGIPNILHCMAI
ncbi:uncharacterized protein LOC143909693 [Arctopsyche grandis]|uniref:uncharacterized protein LOC143909693 n=1 Tax=Arctopsyche grandis TaxID=121162 RepID=UPI00406D6F2F